jgi:hypothetical protein
MTTPIGSKPKPGQKRRHGKRPAPLPSPLQVLAQARTVPQEPSTVEEPLSAHEIARLKVHFRFLKEHRNLLKLRVNATEDLLLNGVREPSHRGVCKHLLAKVERSRVLTVSQTLPPAEAVRLLGGIIRFAPEMGYILRYLECVKQTASQAQAGAAVTEALKQIEFSELSAAQMRQLVSLVADVFAERDLPIFLFTLLYDAPFRTALDRSLDGFPEVLGSMVRPLRAVHDVIANSSSRAQGDRERRRETNGDLHVLKAGVALLLDVNPLSLAELSEPVRRRLFFLGCETLRSQPSTRIDTLHQLLTSLSFPQPSEQMSATVSLVAAMLAAGQEPSAKKLIDRVRKADDTGSILARWRAALDAPRVGTVALDSARANRDLPASGRWYRGWHVPTQSIVLLRYGELAEQPLFAEQVALWRRLLVPGVSRIVAANTEPSKRPYVAVELTGYPLNREAQKSSRIDERLRMRWAVELCALLAALAEQGTVLPDAELSRFNTDQEGRLWLVDLWNLQSVTPEQARLAHCDRARTSCRQLLNMAPAYCVAGDAPERLESAASLEQIVQIFDVR